MKTRNRLWMSFTVLATAVCLSGCQYHRDLMNRNKCWPFVPGEPPGAACAVEPPFFGFHATCWRPWPADWVGCPELIVEEVITPVESNEDAPAAPMEPLPMDDTSADPTPVEPMPLQDTPPESAQPPAANESAPDNPPQVPDNGQQQSPAPVAPPTGSEPPRVPDQQPPQRSGRRTTPRTPTPVRVDQTFDSAIDLHLQPIPSGRPAAPPSIPEVDYRSVIQDVAGDLRHGPPEPLVVTPKPMIVENHTYRPASVEPPAAPAPRLSEFLDFDVKPSAPVTTASSVVLKEHVAARPAEPTPIQEVVQPPIDVPARAAEQTATAKKPLTLKPVKAVVVSQTQPVRRKAGAILVEQEKRMPEKAGHSDEPGLLEVEQDILRPAPILEASKLREGR